MPDEEPTGPWSRTELLHHARCGRYGSQTVARAEGEQRWLPLGEVIPLVSMVVDGLGPTDPEAARLIRIVRARYENGYATRKAIRASAVAYEVLGALVTIAGIVAATTSEDLPSGILSIFSGLVLGALLIGIGILVQAAAETLGAALDTAVHTRVALDVARRDS